MKTLRNLVGLVLLIALVGGVWILRYHPDWLKPSSREEEEEAVATEVPVRTAKIVRTTLREYVDGFGVVDPEPARGGRQAAGAAVASPTAGIVAEIVCEAGQHVSKGAPLVQLDERLAKATEEQAAAALESARATLAKLKATPRPEQVELAQLAVEKARNAVAFAEKGYERQKKLAPQQGTSEKSLQAAELELAAAGNDLRVADKQLALLKASPTREELAEAMAKVTEGEKMLGLAQTQRSLLRVQSPLDATVVRVLVNPGEAVDATKVLVELAALDRLIVNASVPAEDLPSLRVELPVEIRVRSKPAAKDFTPATTQRGAADTRPSEGSAPSDVLCDGKTYFIAPQVDRKTNTVLVGIAVPDKAGLRPGQYVRVRIVVREHRDRLAVPRESVVTDADGNTVVAVVTGNKAVQKPVQVGLREDDLVEIEGSELREGDAVVTEVAYGLPKESTVRLASQ